MGWFDIPYITKQGRAAQKLAQMIENKWAADAAKEYASEASGSMQRMVQIQEERIRVQTELNCLLTKFEKTKEDKKRIRFLKRLIRGLNTKDRLTCTSYNLTNYLANEELRRSKQRNWYNPL